MTHINKRIIFLSGLFFVVSTFILIKSNLKSPPLENKFDLTNNRKVSVESERAKLNSTEKYIKLENLHHEYQTFNNCGPATLSMILNWYGIKTNQHELGSKMRPFQNPEGDNDDKTIFTYEFVEWAQDYGLMGISRVNGDLELIKLLTSNNIPVVVKTWLNKNEDIGHFRLILGYDESEQIIFQDDSYHGPNKKISYYDFLSMWQPFNYDYIIIFKPEMQDIVEEIIGEEMDETKAWENALDRARAESILDGNNIYPVFNISTSAYHLDDFQTSIESFEKVENALPRRMLWYQIEPILAYKETGNFKKVFEKTDKILNGGNRAFSELYIIRGDIFLEMEEIDKAMSEFELALKYNVNNKRAKDYLSRF
jgi:tetratricopeptide (TPR) repeat protein